MPRLPAALLFSTHTHSLAQLVASRRSLYVGLASARHVDADARDAFEADASAQIATCAAAVDRARAAVTDRTLGEISASQAAHFAAVADILHAKLRRERDGVAQLVALRARAAALRDALKFENVARRRLTTGKAWTCMQSWDVTVMQARGGDDAPPPGTT